MGKEVNSSLVELYKPLFEKYPEIKAFGWTQYTPGYNDGEPCRFRSNHDNAECFIEDEEGDLIGTDDEAYDLVNEKILKKFQDCFPDFTDDEMETFFGDGVKVLITPNGVEVEEYDCGY